MKVKVQKKRGRPGKLPVHEDKLNLAAEKSSCSRVISKIARSPTSLLKQTYHVRDKMKQYSLSRLTDYFERKFGVIVPNEIRTTITLQKCSDKHSHVKMKGDWSDAPRNETLFDENEALDYLQTLSRSLDQAEDFWIEDIPQVFINKKESDSSLLQSDKTLTKKNSSLSTTSDTGVRNEEHKTSHQNEEEQYIDQYDIEYTDQSKKDSKTDFKKMGCKWLGKAHDFYRLVENHKKSGIFYEPYIPSDIDSQITEIKAEINPEIEYPITLKTIGIQLSLGLYKSYEDFKYDMMCMFKNSKIYQKGNQSFLKDIETIERKICNF